MERGAFRKIEMVVNTAAGGVRETAPAEAQAILDELGLTAHMSTPAPGDLVRCLKDAVAARPDLLIVLAGDGTARTAVELCGRTGPLVAPLAGGTMNMLPHAIYGARPWQAAMVHALTSGVERPLDGGEVDGHNFLVAAILGAPALWAPAREAARKGDPRLAVRRARVAFNRAFKGRLRYIVEAGPREKAEALVFMCPLISRGLRDDDQALEVAALDPSGAGEAFRLGFHAVLGDWRKDPAVEVASCKLARVWAATGIPALLDGEPVRLKSLAEVRFTPGVGRVLMAREDD